MGEYKEIPILEGDVLTRFWSHVPSDLGKGECWEWQGTRLNTRPGRDYGVFVIKKGFRFAATRIIYKLHYQEDPGQLVVRHKCDNPPCVNPDHLELGTHQDNINDRLQRERTKSKISINDVKEMRKLAAGGVVLEDILEKYPDYDEQPVVFAIRGLTFAHVDQEPVKALMRKPSFNSKLSLDQMREIKEALSKPYWGLQKKLARQYGVDDSVITDFKQGRYDHLLDGKTKINAKGRGV